MKRVYLCHPFSGDAKNNRARAKKIYDEILNQTLDRWNWDKYTYIFPVNPLAIFPPHVDGTNMDRRIAMTFCLCLLKSCDELWVCHETITAGMKEEIEFASKKGIPVIFKTSWECDEKPIYYEYVETRYV